MSSIRSVQIEKHVLAGFLKYPQVYFEVSHFINENDFSNGHKTIFSVVKGQIMKSQPLDPVIIGEKIKNLGINFKQDFNVFDYIESLAFLKISQKSLIDACKNLKTITIRREVAETASLIAEAMENSGDKSPDEIISLADKMYNDRVTAYDLEANPEDLFQDIEKMVEERANNPIAETGYLTPYKLFNKMYGGLRPGELYAWVSRPKHGKALEENTLIPTPNGFTKIKDLKRGDKVFAIDGSVTKVVATQKWKNRKTYKIFTDDHNEVIADENHEWLARYRSDAPMKVYTTKFLHEVNKSKKVALPISEPLQLKKVKLPINPYILGVWLGDGHKNSPSITSEDLEIISSWGYYAKKHKLKIKNNRGKYGYAATGSKGIQNRITEKLEKLGVLNNKHIPQIYLRASEKQRRELLKGLMDTDGYISKTGQAEFCNTNKNIADGVLELIYSLGMKASMRESRAKLYSKDCGPKYRITFYPTDVFKLTRKAVLQKKQIKKKDRYVVIQPNGIANTVCIQIEHPSHMFLCSKAMIPTHNSTILSDICSKSTLINPNMQALILDTEMQTNVIRFRIASSITGIPMWWLETGNFKNNKELLAKWNSKKSELAKAQGKVKHLQVAGKPIAEIESIIQRWYLGQVGRGNPAIVVYDYIKLTGEIEKGKQEYQLIGDKVDRLKELSVRMNIPILTACQLNRSAENGADDSSAIAQSDRLQWFAAYVGIFRRKTLEEQAEDGAQFGTHKMIELASRYQGQHAHGHNDLVRVIENNRPVYRKNFISFNVDNFHVEEKGTLQDIVNHQNGVNVNIFDRPNHEPQEEII